jgi:hypothetical protein
MYIVAIAWGFVVVLMTLTEATSSEGTLLGAFFTFMLYGALPLSIVLYIMGTPMRRKARHAAEARQHSTNPDGSSMPPSDPVTSEGKES